MLQKWKIAMVSIIFLLIAACGTQPTLDVDFRQNVKRLTHGVGSGMIRMNYITTFSWEKLYFFDSDTQNKEIQKRLGFTWTEIENLGEWQKNHDLFVFVENGKVVHYIKFPRKEAKFSVKQPLTPDNAVFKETEENGEKVIKPVGEMN